MLFRHVDLSPLSISHFFGHFVPIPFGDGTYRFYVISNLNGISTFVLFGAMLFRPLGKSFQPLYFSIVCYFDLSTFWTFRANCISNMGLFRFMSFQHLYFSFYAISTHWLFRFFFFFYISTFALSIVCYFDLLKLHQKFILTFWHFVPISFWPFRCYVISIFMVFWPSYFSILCYFGLCTFQYKSFRIVDISILYYSNVWTFHHKSIRPFGLVVRMSFRIWDFSVLCHFEFLWYLYLRTFRSLVISAFWTFHYNSFLSFDLFDLMLFWPVDLSQKVNSTFWTFRTNVISNLVFSVLCHF